MPNRPVILVGPECRGCGACAEVRPDLFAFDEIQQRAVLKADMAPEDAVREAMAWCPCDCIGMGDGPDPDPES